MAVNLKGRSFLTLMDFTPEEIRYLLDLGHDLKAKRRAGVCGETRGCTRLACGPAELSVGMAMSEKMRVANDLEPQN